MSTRYNHVVNKGHAGLGHLMANPGHSPGLSKSCGYSEAIVRAN